MRLLLVLALGESAHRAQIWRLISQIGVGLVARPDFVKAVV
jgi:hypothetical protein